MNSVRIDRIRLLERLKSAAAAAQAKETAAFVASQRAKQQAAGVAADRIGRGIATQVGLAKQMSPFHAQRYTGWAGILTAELPHTFAALRAGRLSEWRAMIVARETAWLSREHRGMVDAELAPRLDSLGDRRLEAEAKKFAYRLDPHGYLARVRGAATDRRVSLRPAPDVMSRLTGCLPAAQGVAAYAALCKEADARRAAGDTRSRGQIMADTLVQRLTGQTAATDVPVEVNLVMSDQSLLGADDEPAHLDGYGTVPAEVARDLVDGPSAATPRWLRRLFTRPDTGQLIAMDARRRCFTAGQRLFLRLRDQTCRTPWCDAQIRHADHIIPADHGGPTSVRNGQSCCVACNHTKQAPGWHTHPGPDRVTITTPTGHRYHSRPPDPPGTRPPNRPSVERRLAQLLAAA
jgi:5-methylcytosine-specific restriction endonuclease McrA